MYLQRQLIIRIAKYESDTHALRHFTPPAPTTYRSVTVCLVDYYAAINGNISKCFCQMMHRVLKNAFMENEQFHITR